MCEGEEVGAGGVVSAVNATHKGHDCCCLAAARFDSAIILTLDSNKNCILFLVLGACNSLQERARVAGISMCVSLFFSIFSFCSCRQITHTPRTRNGPLVNALAVPMTMTGGDGRGGRVVVAVADRQTQCSTHAAAPQSRQMFCMQIGGVLMFFRAEAEREREREVVCQSKLKAIISANAAFDKCLDKG